MQMDVNFANKYIEIITKKLEEQSRNEVMLLTHLEVLRERVTKLTEECQDLKAVINPPMGKEVPPKKK